MTKRPESLATGRPPAECRRRARHRCSVGRVTHASSAARRCRDRAREARCRATRNRPGDRRPPAHRRYPRQSATATVPLPSPALMRVEEVIVRTEIETVAVLQDGVSGAAESAFPQGRAGLERQRNDSTVPESGHRARSPAMVGRALATAPSSRVQTDCRRTCAGPSACRCSSARISQPPSDVKAAESATASGERQHSVPSSTRSATSASDVTRYSWDSTATGAAIAGRAPARARSRSSDRRRQSDRPRAAERHEPGESRWGAECRCRSASPRRAERETRRGGRSASARVVVRAVARVAAPAQGTTT